MDVRRFPVRNITNYKQQVQAAHKLARIQIQIDHKRASTSYPLDESIILVASHTI